MLNSSIQIISPTTMQVMIVEVVEVVGAAPQTSKETIMLKKSGTSSNLKVGAMNRLPELWVAFGANQTTFNLT